MMHCPIHRPVAVRDYLRVRFGRVEHIRAHCRGLPNRFRG
jgi:hypothetical protein